MKLRNWSERSCCQRDRQRVLYTPFRSTQKRRSYIHDSDQKRVEGRTKSHPSPQIKQQKSEFFGRTSASSRVLDKSCPPPLSLLLSSVFLISSWTAEEFRTDNMWPSSTGTHTHAFRSVCVCASAAGGHLISYVVKFLQCRLLRLVQLFLVLHFIFYFTEPTVFQRVTGHVIASWPGVYDVKIFLWSKKKRKIEECAATVRERIL